MMKLVVRIFALSIVIAGVTAAAMPKSASAVRPSHQSATASFPVPCGIYCR